VPALDGSNGDDVPMAQPFDVDALLALPRLSGLAVSPDGTRLVTAVAQPDREGRKHVSALWAIDTTGAAAPRLLTRSAPGESGAAFLRDGSLVFTSARPDPLAADDDPRGEAPALWCLPAGGGDPYVLAAPPGGVDRVAVARGSDVITFAASSHPGTADWAADAEREKARADAGVTAQLFSQYPIRDWDHYLGVRERHLHHATVDLDAESLQGLTDVFPDPGRSLDDTGFDITPDGRTVVASVWRQEGADPRDRFRDLVAVDTTAGERRVLATGEYWFDAPACSPDGRWVAALRGTPATPEQTPRWTLWLVDLASGEGRDLTPGVDLWPHAAVWAADSSAVLFPADEQGRTPVYRVDIATGAVTRMASRGAFTDLCPAPDGSVVYALQSMVTSPPQPVALDPLATDGEPRPVTDRWAGPSLPGTLERVSVPSADGTHVSSWLLLPPGASDDHPAPLAVLIHGGPLSSWSGWHWRWSPHVFTARGYAVLLPDPALSTGYGQRFIDRGWGRWGEVVYDDVMAATEAVCWRPDIDRDRVAALGGSFGGYMANWIAGQTGRFSAIVTHASLWNLREFHGSTDLGVWWEQEFGDPYLDGEIYERNSPHHHVGNITTPMLVIHGEQDYRVPIGQALALWTDLRRHGVPGHFLYFPDENHWILRPANSRLWYGTVLAFLDHHVLGRPWEPPALL
jgi:dipeptidyl aminopeptidase/acylaminoacyl peptidase